MLAFADADMWWTKAPPAPEPRTRMADALAAYADDQAKYVAYKVTARVHDHARSYWAMAVMHGDDIDVIDYVVGPGRL